MKSLVRIIRGFDTFNQLMGWKPDWKAFNEVVNQIINKFTMTFDADMAIDANDEVFKHSKLFIRDALTFWVFTDAIRHEDIGTMWLVYTFWLFMFRGAGQHNYGNEILEMTAQYKYEMEPPLRQVMERTWLVNRWGKPGRSIPTDRYMEHNNGFIKAGFLAGLLKDADHSSQNLFSASPSCSSISYIKEKGSGPVEILRKLSRDVAAYFNTSDVNQRHSDVSKGGDIKALVMDLTDAHVHTLNPGRTIMLDGSHKAKGATKTKGSADKGKVAANKEKEKDKVTADKAKGITDIFTEGKEVWEQAAFRSWKNRTGILGSDVFGCDAEFQHQYEAEVGLQGSIVGMDGAAQDDSEVQVEFDALEDPGMDGET